MPLLKRIALALGLGLLLVAGGALWSVRRHLPGRTPPPLLGLHDSVSVDFDGRGIPTLHAQTWSDLMRVQGYLAARERLFQMDLMRRKADGRLAELVGRAALPLDRLHRIYGFRDVATHAVASLPAEEREDLEAFAEGVNAFITAHPGKWGLEFQMLGAQPEPWTPADSLKVLLLMHEDMSTTWRQELQERALEALPPPTRAFLTPRFAPDDAPVVPDANPGPTLESEAFFRTPGIAAQALPSVDLGIFFPLPSPQSRQASNNWVISGRRTASGRPILANDPHLNLSLPSVWMTLRLEWQGRFAQGVALPGLPGLVIGHNDRLAWGITNLGTDVQDLYQESATSKREERIGVKGSQPEELQVDLGPHGPQVRLGLSLAWAALDPRNLRIPTRAITHATDWDSFNRAADGWLGPAMNLVYADGDGHIGWRATGVIPKRIPGDDGSRIHSGAAGTWLGYVPASDMPRLLDPPEGFIATANNRTIGTSFPHPVTTEWAGTSRVARIRQRLAGAPPWTLAEVEALQRDGGSTFHESLGQTLVPLSETPFTFTQLELLRRTLRTRLLAKLLQGASLAPAQYAWQGEDSWILAAARATPAQWRLSGLGDKAALLKDCLQEAQASPDWQRPWPQVNELRMKHPFGLNGGALGWLFNPPALRFLGSAKSIRAQTGIHGQSMRMVVDFSDLDGTRLVLPLGESGHLGSTHRTDQTAAWVNGDPDGTRTRLHQRPRWTLTFHPAESRNRTSSPL